MPFLVRLIPPRPTFPGDMTKAEAEAMERHADYWRGLMRRDIAVAAGPVSDDELTWGLGVFDLDDEAAARDLLDADPAVEFGIFTYELRVMGLLRI